MTPTEALRELIGAVDALQEAIERILHTTEVRTGLGHEETKIVAMLVLDAKVRLEQVKKVL